ncbi:MAG TPA: pyridoxal-dependent decarboxylase [Pseudobdellovibrionaceae bacterium]|jgi:glutamate/tyrosine decarboxylase-like PLP-dependent enzyme
MENLKCSPTDVSLKSCFLGPKAENGDWVLEEVTAVFKRWFEWRRELFPEDGKAISSTDQQLKEFQSQRAHAQRNIENLLSRFENEIPKFAPRYIGHMFSEFSLPAFFGHIITLIHNPNNISTESSKVGIQIEDEAIQNLADMLGMPTSFGHFTSGGTVANFECLTRAIERVNKWLFLGLEARRAQEKPALTVFEAAHMGWDEFSSLESQHGTLDLDWSNPLVRARRIEKIFKLEEYAGPVLLVPYHKHYSWTKGASLFGLGEESLWPIELNEQGTLSLESLRQSIEKAKKLHRPIAAVVSVLGTTEMGFVDPIDQVQQLLDQYQKEEGLYIWHHVDAAFGGFFAVMKSMEALSKDLRRSLTGLSRVNSITIDPHKMGYVPYSSGAFLARQEEDYYVKSFVAPYVQFQIQKDKGPFTLEGSRSAAGAVATWLTAQSIGFTEQGYGSILERTIRGKNALEKSLQREPLIRLAPATGLNILGFCIAADGDSFEKVNQKTLALFQAISEAPSPKFFVSKTKLYRKSYEDYLLRYAKTWSYQGEVGDLEVIRICIMNPFFDSKELNLDLKQEFSQYLSQEIKKLS